MIANCGSNEWGSGYGGQAGDQTGSEYRVRSWYSKPWKCVLRYPDSYAGVVIAQIARDAANNDNIGYDMGQRMTFYQQLSRNNWDAKTIRTACEADCSSSTAACIIAAGHKIGNDSLAVISPYLTTSNLRSALRAANFQLLTDSRYLTGQDYLMPGDVLLNDGSHAAINLDAGIHSGSSIIVSEDDNVSIGGNLYSETSDADDAILREIGYMNGITPTINQTTVRLSIINYTSALNSLFAGLVGGTSGSSIDTSKVQGNYRVIIEFIMQKGLNAAAGCGIAANIRGESNANPSAVSGDGYGSVGICQWTFGRKTNMLNFVGPNWRNNLTGQLEFLWHELSTSYNRTVLQPLQQVPNNEAGARRAADIFVRKFEVPANVNLRSQQRQQWASDFWNQLVPQLSA